VIVLLHPIGLDRRCWGWMADETGIRHEFPGHGLRSAIRGDISLTDLADDLLRRTPEEPLDLVGVSLGGAVALQFSLRYPLRVRSLLVACGGSQRLQRERCDRRHPSTMVHPKCPFGGWPCRELCEVMPWLDRPAVARRDVESTGGSQHFRSSSKNCGAHDACGRTEGPGRWRLGARGAKVGSTYEPTRDD